MYEIQLIYLPQQYTPTACEEGPDTSMDQINVLKNDWSYSHRHWQGHSRVEDAYRVRVQVEELVLPVRELLAKC